MIRATRGCCIAALLALAAPAVLAHGVSEAAHQRMLEGGWLDYMAVGAGHMLTGYDHLLFLLGVVFFLERFLDILKFVTAFTLGHTLTLIFATYASITADHHLVDAVIALSVIYKGFENLDGFKRWIGVPAPNLLAMVFAFGLIHGFGLSTRLQEMTLAQDPQLLLKILCFNLGVELGQIAALLAMTLIIRLWRRTPYWPPVARITNGGLIAAGTLLLLFQLHGYIHAGEAAAGAHTHDTTAPAHE